MKISQRWRRGLLAVAVLAGLASACDKNPVDAAIEAALDFEGYFRADDGTEIELDGSYAYVRKVGSTVLVAPLEIGDRYMIGMAPTGTPGEFSGWVVDRTGMLGRGTVRLDDGSLTVTSRDGTAPTGQTNWTKTTAPSTPPGGGGTTNPPPATGTTTTVLSASGLSGLERSRRVWQIQVPAGTKQLRVTTSEDNEFGGNLGDLFVRRGAEPAASHHPYVWTADCASVESNRAPETCTINDPPAGTWYVLLYGYHEYWGTTIKATITR